MSEPPAITRHTLEFPSLDGHHLVGDLAVPSSVIAAAVVCHPHPQYGGNPKSASDVALSATSCAYFGVPGPVPADVVTGISERRPLPSLP
jgi:hypothetical protein